ncbi:kinesin-like protein KIN-7O isoform X2 [Cornus florida]|uniref:kinesin-like protein KIN-7O isoform X2 n=1 Tax=Cornus florida TaxID=4283 RepID=UPI002897F5BC|nr:kinesin-like protein KIN-7O isoform X2 [Cornus florida]
MERINVAVRSRPLCVEDAKNSPWRISGNSISIPNHSFKFEFDRIFGEECKTVEVYEARTKEIVAAAVRGFNGTVFAYGQTNSGKTHTMRGSATEPGVIPLAVYDLFDIIQEDMDREFLLRMSYMEIYNEEINDLLAPEHRKLQIHESIERGIFVAGLKEEIVASPEQVLELMEFGESHRHIGETNMNLYSSRSHTIFRMIIESRDKSEGEDSGISCDAVRVSVLNLVDLAGSERAAKTGAEGVRLKEGSHINKSLMTLGTVIKKLSEGAESQGSHVPYRDSKLTRILQPALGGNANTAIICNITLAQIHADETRSSLQFASRALRVTNCAHVNEILTDAALLKRQKKEIEELRAKLQGPHSEHLEEEILILRNTLLQTELERERIALELEEEKKAQAEREKRLQEQAKKIENLSSMVLCSNRDENRDYYKKAKRRDTWCPGNLSRETLGELHSTVQAKASAVKPVKAGRDMGPLLPFEELVNEVTINASCKHEEDCASNAVEDCTLPDARALLHVTSRRKVPLRKKSLLVEDDELADAQAEYENLLLKFETQWITSEVQIDYLTRKLSEADFGLDETCKDHSTYHPNKITTHGDTNISLRDSEAILVIKQLQEKIKMLEVEKFSSQQNLDCVVELATEQNICAREKYEELYEELLNAREDARVACEQLISTESTTEETFDSMKLLMEVHEIISEVHASRNVVESVPSVVDEFFESFSAILNLFADLKSLINQNSVQLKDIINNHETLHSFMSSKITELENEKLFLYNQSGDLDNQIRELNLNVQNSEKALTELSEEYEMEKADLLSQIRTLEKEVSCLSNCSLAREKETMRKDLEKTRTRLRETEFKLKNAIQEKTKLEGEKACANREIKLLHGQKAILERDISKCDSLTGRRRDSVIDRSSNVFEPKRAKGLSVAIEQTMQEEYKKLEVLAFEMETTIASLEEELAAANGEKEQATTRNECVVSELHALSDKLSMSNSELSMLQEEVSSLRLHLEEFKFYNQKLESSFNTVVEQKEEMAMQLTDALLAMEEEKAIWSAKEKASIEAIEEKAKSYNAEIMLLSKEMSQVKNELEFCREQCKVLEERVTFYEENEKLEKCSMDKSLRNDQLRDDLRMADNQSERSQETLKSNLEMPSLEHRRACEEVDKLRMELSVVSKEREDFLTRVRESDAGSVLTDDFQNIKNQLLIMTMERDKLMTQIEEQQSHEIALDLCKESYDEMLLKAKTKVEEMTGRLSKLEVKMHNDEINNNKVKAKLRMRLQGAQMKLDTYRLRYKEAIDETEFMNRRFEEASAKLKDQLASYGTEVLNLKRQIAIKGNE